MNQQNKISVVTLAHLGYFAGIYPLYYLLTQLFAQLLKAPTAQILPLGVIIGLGFMTVSLNLLLTIRPIRTLFLGALNFGAVLFISYLGFAYLNGELSSLAIYLQTLQASQGDVSGCITAWILLILVAMMLFKAMRLSVKLLPHEQVRHQFDLSIGLLFIGLLLLNILAINPGDSFIAMGICLLANAIILNLTRISQAGSGLRWLVLLPFTGVVVVTGWLINLAIPWLTSGSRWIWGAAMPGIQSITERFLIWLFTGGHRSEGISNTSSSSSGSANSGGIGMVETGQAEWLQHLGLVLIWIIIGVVSILSVLLLIYWLVRLFYRKSPGRLLEYADKKEKGRGNQIIPFLIQLFVRFSLLLQAWNFNRLDVAELYYYLLIWGNFKRHPRNSYETPYEYSSRLGRIYPHQRDIISTVTELYVTWRYGKKAVDVVLLQQIRSSLRLLWKRISSDAV